MEVAANSTSDRNHDQARLLIVLGIVALCAAGIFAVLAQVIYGLACHGDVGVTCESAADWQRVLAFGTLVPAIAGLVLAWKNKRIAATLTLCLAFVAEGSWILLVVSRLD